MKGKNSFFAALTLTVAAAMVVPTLFGWNVPLYAETKAETKSKAKAKAKSKKNSTALSKKRLRKEKKISANKQKKAPPKKALKKVKKKKKPKKIFVKLKRTRNKKKKLKHLKFDTRKYQVKWNKEKPYIRIKGTYSLKTESLITRDAILILDAKSKNRQKSKNQKFKYEQPIKKKNSTVTIFAVDAKGNKKTETIFLEVLDWPGFLEKLKKPKSPKRHFFNFGLGPTFMHFQERTFAGTPAARQNSLLLTAKFTYTWQFIPKMFDFSMNTFFNVVPIAKAGPSTADARFLGINGRVGYHMPFMPSPWKLTLSGGWYFISMFVSNSSFGFSQMNGPQLFPMVSRKFGRHNSGYAYVKFSPITAGGFSLTFDSHELAFGAGWISRLGKTDYQLTYHLDYSNLNVNIENLLLMTGYTLSFSVGFGF